ncbi:MAG TPA: MFS transporter [Candidatus Saccharimonadales bacterium]|nr:MFS transporter [Candidatus Saccharimonadales bacterium]
MSRREASPRTFRALRHRNFRLFAGGQLISLVGTWMQSVAQSWLLYRLTHSAVMLGAMGFLGQIPILLLGPVAGVAADRMRRRNIVVTTQTLSLVCAFTLAGLTLASAVREWHIFAAVLVMGCVNAFDMPARQAFLVEMVGREDLPNAIALNSSMFNGARIVGPAIAGLVVAALGEGWCFLLNGVSYVAVLVGLARMRLEPRAEAPPTRGVLAHLHEGVTYVAGEEAVWRPLVLLGVVSLTAMPYLVILPIFADRVLHGGARGLGLLMSGAGVGALAAALVLARRESPRGLGPVLGLAPVGFGLALLAFSFSRDLWLSTAVMVPVGFCMMTQMASTNTTVQSVVPDLLRGRVMGLYGVMFLGVAPFGSLLVGWLAHTLGAPSAVRLGAGCAIVSGLIFLAQLGRFQTALHRMMPVRKLEPAEPPIA